MENKQLEAALNEINELKAALSLKQSDIISSRLAAIVDSSDDAIIGKDLNSIITSWNQGAEKIFGYTSAEMVGTSIMRLIPADRQTEESFILGKIRRGEKVDHFETQRQAKDGRLIEVSVCASPIKDATGKVIGASKIARDITERKLTERALLQSEARLNFALQTSHIGAWELSLTDKTAHRTLIHANIFGYDTLESVWTRGKFLEHVLPEDRPKVNESFHAAAAICGNFNFECRIRRADGETRWIWVAGGHELDSTGKAAHISGLVQDITERKLGEALLLEREEQLRLFAEHSPAAIAMFDQDMKYLVVSQRWKRDFNLGDQSIIGLSHYEVFPEIPQHWKEVHRRCLAGAVEKCDEEPFRRADGTTNWIRWEVWPWRRANGLIGGIIIFSEDISARKQSETELRWKTAFLEAQVSASPDGILVVDNHNKRILQNQRLIELFHVPKAIAEDNDDANMLRHVTAQVKNPEQFFERVEHLYAHPDEIGHDEIELVDGKFLDRYSSPVRDEAGNYYGRIWEFRDITESKRAEASLRLLESAIKQTKESVMITEGNLDLPGPKIVFVNPAFTQMTGYTAEEVIGKTPRILQGLGTDRTVVRRLRENLERGEPFEGEATNYRKGGKEFDMEWQIAPLRDASGKITHFVATQRDITERKKLEAQFRQSQKMESIGQLAGGVAHDFNNILAIILMQSELLKSNGGLSASQAEFADEIGLTVQRAAALTRQLLLFSRREVFQPRDLDLSASITSTAKMLGRILGENIQMQLKLASQPMFIHADAGMIDQILLNLTVNARDAMPNGGQLLIETSGVEFDEFAASQSAQVRIGSFVRLSVSDSGCGIPPEIIPKIFEPFFTTKDVGKGTGLGLATVFGIVKQHQGWINVYSEVNHGTTFRIYLPRLAKNGGQKSAQPTLATLRGGHETILLVEDDPPLRLSMNMALSQLGYRILDAPTGVKALEVWHENRNEISLLLTDLVMPDGMTGKNLAQHILHENPKLKVIFMSGYSAELVGKDFPLKEGVNFLTKPFQAVKLAQAVRNSLDQPA
jgi:PAS domain S-box-containing protein